MPGESRGIEKPCFEDLDDDMVKAPGDQGQWKDRVGAEGGEDGAEDLGLLNFASLGD
jgi:hypothetical protein